jgi:sugar phosphate permease
VAQFLIFLLAYVLSQFYRSFLAVIAPELGQEFSLDATGLSTASMAWFLAFALSQFAVGAALDKAGPRRTMPAFMSVAVAGAIVFASATGFAGIVAAMVLIGIGSAAIYMGAVYTFARTVPAHRFAQACSWLLGLGSLGNLLSATPLAYAAETLGWRTTFLAIAALTALSGLLILAVIRDPAPPAATTGPAPGFWRALGTIVGIRALWPMVPLLLISYAVLLAERGLWVGPYFAQVHGLGPTERGNAILAMAAAMAVGALLYGPADRVFGTRKWVVATGTAVTAGLLAALGLLPGATLTTSVVLITLIGATGMTYAVLLAHVRNFLPDNLIGRGITLVNFLFFAGAAALQPLSGWAVDGMRAAGAAPPEVFAALHFGFAGLLTAALLVYLGAREDDRGQSATPRPGR